MRRHRDMQEGERADVHRRRRLHERQLRRRPLLRDRVVRGLSSVHGRWRDMRGREQRRGRRYLQRHQELRRDGDVQGEGGAAVHGCQSVRDRLLRRRGLLQRRVYGRL